jgi:hypothetical protein
VADWAFSFLKTNQRQPLHSAGEALTQRCRFRAVPGSYQPAVSQGKTREA